MFCLSSNKKQTGLVYSHKFPMLSDATRRMAPQFAIVFQFLNMFTPACNLLDLPQKVNTLCNSFIYFYLVSINTTPGNLYTSTWYL